MKKIFMILVGCLLLMTSLFAVENEQTEGDLFKYIPYVVAVIIFLISSKLKPKKTEAESKPLIQRNFKKTEVGPKDTYVDCGTFKRDYKPIEPK